MIGGPRRRARCDGEGRGDGVEGGEENLPLEQNPGPAADGGGSGAGPPEVNPNVGRWWSGVRGGTAWGRRWGRDGWRSRVVQTWRRPGPAATAEVGAATAAVARAVGTVGTGGGGEGGGDGGGEGGGDGVRASGGGVRGGGGSGRR